MITLRRSSIPSLRNLLFAEFIKPYENDDGIRTVMDSERLSFHPHFADLLDFSKPVPMMWAEAELTSNGA